MRQEGVPAHAHEPSLIHNVLRLPFCDDEPLVHALESVVLVGRSVRHHLDAAEAANAQSGEDAELVDVDSHVVCSGHELLPVRLQLSEHRAVDLDDHRRGGSLVGRRTAETLVHQAVGEKDVTLKQRLGARGSAARRDGALYYHVHA